jgi:hypothetical protein
MKSRREKQARYLIDNLVDSIINEELSSVNDTSGSEGTVGERLPRSVNLDMNVRRASGVVSREDGCEGGTSATVHSSVVEREE